MRQIALIPAAGVGLRFGAGKPKQYVEIAGKTVLQHTLDVFLNHAAIDAVAVVLSPDDAVFQTGINFRIFYFIDWILKSKLTKTSSILYIATS